MLQGRNQPAGYVPGIASPRLVRPMPDQPASDNIPTMIVQPTREQVKAPAKLSYDDLVKRAIDHGYSRAGAIAIANNFMRESQGDPNAVGDKGTSEGLGQWHLTRLDDLNAHAKSLGKPANDPDVQFSFMDKELREKYPALRKQLVMGTDPDALTDSFKRVYERPASIMWQSNPNARVGSDRLSYTDDAVDGPRRKRGTDVRWMSPQDYLDLAPPLEEEPFTSPSGRSVQASAERGEPFSEIPSLKTQVDGNTATVTGNDGRHRALLAQQEGLDAIPVAIQRQGKGEPTEIQGASGTVLPHDFPKVEGKPSSWLGQLGNAILPSAAAAEATQAVPNPFSAGGDGDQQAPAVRPGAVVDYDPFDGAPPAPAQGAPAAQSGQAPAVRPGAVVYDDPFGGGATHPAPAPITAEEAKQADGFVPDRQTGPDNALLSGVKGFGQGVGNFVYGLEDAAGRAFQDGGVPAVGNALRGNARAGLATMAGDTAADQQAHPWATGAGRVAGGMVGPGAVALAARNPWAGAALQGIVSGGADPNVREDHYWGDKAKNAAVDGILSVGLNALGLGTAKVLAPQISEAARRLMNAGVELMPGQLLGGALRRIESTVGKYSPAGSMFDAAERRSLDSYGRAALNRALRDIGEEVPKDLPPDQAVAYAQAAASKRYDDLLKAPGVRMHATPDFMKNMIDLGTLAEEMKPEDARRFSAIVRNQVGHYLQEPARSIDGQTFKVVESNLTRRINQLRANKEYDLSDALATVREHMREALEESNPGLRDQLQAANRTYAKLSRIEEAVNRRPTGAGRFTPTDLWHALRNDARRTGRLKAFARGDGEMTELANDGISVLPEDLPGHHSWESKIGRALSGGGILAGGMGLNALAHELPAVLGMAGLAGATALPYLRSASNKIVNTLASQAPWKQMASTALRAVAPALGTLPSLPAAPKLRDETSDRRGKAE